MSDLVLSVAPELKERLEGLAAKMGRSVEACVELALVEFVEHWEDFTHTVEVLETGGEERTVLRAVND
jgi:predicted DNA-binding protein